MKQTNPQERMKAHSIITCMDFVKMGVLQNDRDCVRSYYEQLNDLIIEFLGEE